MKYLIRSLFQCTEPRGRGDPKSQPIRTQKIPNMTVPVEKMLLAGVPSTVSFEIVDRQEVMFKTNRTFTSRFDDFEKLITECNITAEVQQNTISPKATRNLPLPLNVPSIFFL